MRKRAFSLTELLIVIIIISIIASIAFPVFTQAKSKAQSTVCLSNIRQIYTALSLYESAFGEYPPNTLTWPGLKPYYTTRLHCPVAPPNTIAGFDYIVYDFFAPDPKDPIEQNLYQGWEACKQVRGPSLPIIFDKNHDLLEQGYATGSRYVLVGRFDGSVSRIDSTMANDRRMAGDLPCPDAPDLYMNF